MTLVELKQKAIKLGLTPDDVRQFGHLGKKASWEAAISNHEQAVISNQSSVASEALEQNCPTCEDKPVYRCWSCEGTGERVDPEVLGQTVFDCPRCDGKGFKKHDELENPQWLKQVHCPDCGKKTISADQFAAPISQPQDDESVLDALATIVAKIMGPDVVVKPWLLINDEPKPSQGEDPDVIYKPEPLAWIDGEPLYPLDVDDDQPADPNEKDDEEDEDDDDELYNFDEATLKLSDGWQSRSITTINISTQLPPKLSDLTEDSPQTLVDELRQKMATYVGEVIPPHEFEQLENEPLDETTAAVLLGWLNASESLELEAVG